MPTRFRIFLSLLLAPPLAPAQAAVDLSTTAPPALQAPLSVDSRSLNLGDAAQKPKAKPFEFKFKASGDRSSVGLEAGGGLGEGKRLEAMVWGSGGAVIGSLAGPVGAMIGAAAGAAAGLFVAIFIVPHNGPEERR